MVLISVSEPEKPLPVFVTFRWQYMSYGFCSKIAIKTFLITYWSVTGAEQSLWRPHLVDRLTFLSLAIRHNQIFRVFPVTGKLDIILQVVVKCQIYVPMICKLVETNKLISQGDKVGNSQTTYHVPKFWNWKSSEKYLLILEITWYDLHWLKTPSGGAAWI